MPGDVLQVRNLRYGRLKICAPSATSSSPVNALQQCLKPAARQIFFEVQRIKAGEVFRRNVNLFVEERRDRRVALVHRMTLDARRRFAHQQAVQRRAQGTRGPSQHARRRKMPMHDLAGLFGCYCSVKLAGLPRRAHLHHRRAMTHAHATDPLHLHVHPGFRHRLMQRCKQVVAAFGHATRPQPHVDLGASGALCLQPFGAMISRTVGVKR